MVNTELLEVSNFYFVCTGFSSSLTSLVPTNKTATMYSIKGVYQSLEISWKTLEFENKMPTLEFKHMLWEICDIFDNFFATFRVRQTLQNPEKNLKTTGTGKSRTIFYFYIFLSI